MWRTMPASTGRRRGTTWPLTISTRRTAGCSVQCMVGASLGLGGPPWGQLTPEVAMSLLSHRHVGHVVRSRLCAPRVQQTCPALG